MKNFFFIRKSGKYIKIRLEDILYIEGCRNYLKIVTLGSTHLILVTFKRMEEMLNENMFTRIHKSYIVAIDKITEFGSDFVNINDRTLPIGHNYRGKLEKLITIISDEVYQRKEQQILTDFKRNIIAV
ncbi:MAG TPA: LytTR family DNA-binding domain-containing protein [Chitinophagaceae bacterium]|nr:LytTR family DNA-binding domain-containing protein [Chitinophagaceae bacterium]